MDCVQGKVVILKKPMKTQNLSQIKPNKTAHDLRHANGDPRWRAGKANDEVASNRKNAGRSRAI
jgi:hypothetical protein